MSAARIVVVSYLAHDPFSPRGIRTRALVRELERQRLVELIAAPAPSPATDGTPLLHRLTPLAARRWAGRLPDTVLIDRLEAWSRARFRTWEPQADGALLIGYPFSPLSYAASRLAACGIPFAVDVGDPWALTAAQPIVSGLGLARARRAERALWSRAAAAIVTTEVQRDRLQKLFPALPVLVQPNGLDAVDAAPLAAPAPRGDGRLALAHFGSVYGARIDIRPFLTRLASSGAWREVDLALFGSGGWSRHGLPDNVRLRHEILVPWNEAVVRAREFDAALVIGNIDEGQLPSKAVSYLTLPIPRIAVTLDRQRDATAEYARSRPGWLVVSADATDAARDVRRHVERRWRPEELAPPADESWDVVAARVVRFVDEAAWNRSSTLR